jgi:hypothetical protein
MVRPPSLLTVVVLALAAARLQAQQPPRTPFVARGSCPFECCQLGAWTARDTLPVFDRERATGSPRFLFLPGDAFRADSADFYTLALGLIRARRPFSLLDYLAARDSASRAAPGLAPLRAPLAPGDSIYLVGEASEEGPVVWARGTTAVVEPFWAEGSELDDPAAPAVLIRPIVHEWWVHVTANGRSGWIQAWDRRIDGRDACA